MTFNKAPVYGPVGDGEPGGRSLARFATGQSVRRQRRIWSGRVASWDRHGSAGLTKVTEALLQAAQVTPSTVVVDLGSGNGQISLPLARQGAHVLAVDVSSAMVGHLLAQAQAEDLSTLAAVAVPIEELMLPARSVDLVVSSYALHHLRDPDKARLVAAAAGWLRPGGRLVVADMMFGRGSSSRDRAIIRAKLAALARKGPGGWWRIAKNAARYALRIQERPVPMKAWTAMFAEAGLAEVTSATVVAEAGLVTGRRPGAEPQQPHP